MNCRYISIGLSAVVFLGIAGVFGVFGLLFSGPLDPFSAFLNTLLCIALLGFPPIISITISVFSKHIASHIFSAIISLLYGSAIAYVIISIVFFGAPAGSPVMALLGGILLLPILLPLWIVNIVIEVCCRIRHRKKNQPTPSES